jgi:hypothetical protein
LENFRKLKEGISGFPGLDIFDDYFGLYTKTEDEIRGQAWLLGRVTMEMLG